MTAVLDDLAPAAWTPAPDADLVGTCDGCGRHRPIVAGILLLETGDRAAEDMGFCTPACMVRYVTRRWIETPVTADPFPAWHGPIEFSGLPYTTCPGGDGRIEAGQLVTIETRTGTLWHDYCAMRHVTVRNHFAAVRRRSPARR